MLTLLSLLGTFPSDLGKGSILLQQFDPCF